MRIVHLSDIHLNKEHVKDFEFFIECLIRDLKKFNSYKSIDLIFITGDLIDKGGKSFQTIDNAFKEFYEWIIKPIIKEINLSRNRIIFVPGNHDINRYEDSETIEVGLKNRLINTDKINKFIDEDNNEELKRILNYKSFEREYYNNYIVNNEIKITNFQTSHRICIQGVSVGINSFNTAWRCYDSNKDKNHIILGERQVRNGLNEIKNCDIKIALMHHQLDWLAEFDQEDIERIINRNYDMVFCGHVHKGSSWSKSGIYGENFTSIAPANGIDNIRERDLRYCNGYSVIDYCTNDKKIVVNHRIYSQQLDEFVENVMLCPKGIKEYKILKDINIKKNNDTDININKDVVLKHDNYEKLNNNYDDRNEFFSDVIIKNNLISIVFGENKENIKNILNQIPHEDTKYTDLYQNIDLLLILGDKLLYKLKLTNNIENIKMIEDLKVYLSNFHEKSEDKFNYFTQLFKIIEWWLKSINSYLNIDKSEEKNNFDKHINNIIDKVNDKEENYFLEILLSAKNTYYLLKEKTEENIYKINILSEFEMRIQVIVNIILPIYLHLEDILKITSRIRIGDYENENIKELVNAVKRDYKSLLYDFKGRESEIENLYEVIIKNQFVILKGDGKVGKSSVIAKIVEKLMQQGCNNSSCFIIMHSFKHSKNIHEMVQSIVEQCNITLLNKIDIKILDELSVYNCKECENKNLENNMFTDVYEIYRKVIREAIDRVLVEYKEIYIFLDSLDLMNNFDDKIQKLFYEIPSKSHILLCTGTKNEGIGNIVNNSKVKDNVIEINNFNRKEISLITEIEEEKNYDQNEKKIKGKTINDKIYEKTGGNIELIKDLKLKIKNEDRELNLTLLEQIDENKVQFFEQSANEWITKDSIILEDILLMLAIFDPINVLSLEKIQSFINFKGLNYRLPKIRNTLNKVNNQMVTFNYDKLKLSNKEFANYIISKYFSKKDIELFIENIFDWMANDGDLSYIFIADFFRYVKMHTLINNINFEKNISKFIKDKEEKQDDKHLFNMGLCLYFEYKDMIQYAMKMLEKSIKMDNPAAKAFLGHCLINGKKVEENIARGEKLLREASNQGSIEAKIFLGNILIDGIKINKNSEEGKKLLLEATLAGSDNAKLNLANRLITGRGIKPNPVRGKEMLLDLIKKDNVDAIRILGNRFIDGAGIQQDVKQGKELLDKAINIGNTQAKLQLATRLIIGDVLEQDVKLGLKMIEELVRKGNKDAKIILAKMKLFGLNIKRDVGVGKKIIEELVNENDSESIVIYADLLIDGEVIEKNIRKGYELLEKEGLNNNLYALRILGNRLIDGCGVEKDKTRGQELLKTALEKGDIESGISLANRLIDGEGISKNVTKGIDMLKKLSQQGSLEAKVQYGIRLTHKEMGEREKEKGIELLEYAAVQGDCNAKRYLGNILIDGEVVNKNILKGKKLLQEAINQGNIKATSELGYRLLYGIGLECDIKTAENLLIKAIGGKDNFAKTVLGKAIILGYSNKFSIKEGVEFLEDASKEDALASKILGEFLIKGLNIKQDKVKGKNLLVYSSNKGYAPATRSLAGMLLDGIYLIQDKQKGEKLLTELMDSGDELAAIDLAERMVDGKGVKEDKKNGEKIFKELIEKNINAKCKYGMRLLSGNGVVKNPTKGEDLLREAVKQEDFNARRILAVYIIEGMITTSTKEQAIELLEKNIAEGNKHSMMTLGDMLLDGENLDQNIERGIKLLELAILEKSIDAKVDLGIRLLEGRKIDQDKTKGLKLLEEAVRAGHLGAKLSLAERLIDGELVDKNIMSGMIMLNELISDGSKKAKRILALKLIKGDGIERNLEKGVELIEELIKQDDIDAITIYSEILLDGIYIQQDIERGSNLLFYAEKIQDGNKEKNNGSISYIIAYRMVNGDGLKKHKSNAIKKFKKSIRHDNKYAMFEYGLRTQKGYGIAKNENKGKNYVKKAIEKSDSIEKCSLGIIAYKLKEFELASQLFYEAYIDGVLEANNSLAYMIRRKEIKGKIELPSVDNLLKKDLDNNSPNAKINFALNLVKRYDKNQDWVKADKIFRSLGSYSESIEWWYEISKEGDLEGDLVLGWLGRHSLLGNFDKISFNKRLTKVNQRGWNLPNWMFELDAYSEEEDVEMQIACTYKD